MRDHDGLALSSRNTRFTPQERELARCTPPGPRHTRRGAAARAMLERLRGLDVDYVEIAPFDPPVIAGADPHRRHTAHRQHAAPGVEEHPPEHACTRCPRAGKLPITELAQMKQRGEPIAMVTAYDAPGGRLADEAGVDMILVGDSAAMAMLGHDSTVPATMDEMLVLTRAVTRGARRPLVVARHAVRLLPGVR